MKDVVKHAKKCDHYEVLIDKKTLRYASCFRPNTTSQMMAMLLDNVDKGVFFQSSTSTTGTTTYSTDNDDGAGDPHRVCCANHDYLDVIIGGYTIHRRYSIDAIAQTLRRSFRQDLLYAIYFAYYDTDFNFLTKEEFLSLSSTIIDENPSLLSCVDEGGNIPLHYACIVRHSDVLAETLIHKALHHCDVLSQGGLLVKNEVGITPAQILMHNESNLSLLSNLVEDGILRTKDIEQNCFIHEALQQSNENVARFILEKFPSEISRVTTNGDLPLHIATSRRLNLDLVHILVSKGVKHSVGKGCGGLCIDNFQNVAPIQTIVENYDDDDVTEFLQIWMSSNVINEEDVIEKYLLEIALQQMSVDVITLIVHKYPKSLQSSISNKSTPLHLACERDVDHSVIRLMIDKGIELFPKEQCGGLLVMDENETMPLQLLVALDSFEIANLFRYLFESKQPILHSKDIIKYNLDRIAIRNEAPKNYRILYNCLSNEMMEISMIVVDEFGRGNIFYAIKRRLSDEFIVDLVKERIRVVGNSGLFDKDNFGDMPINILLRPHFPSWPQSVSLVEELIRCDFITNDEISKFYLLHKIAIWPRCQHCREKAQLMINLAPDCLSNRNNEGNLPIHEVFSLHKNWRDIQSMLEIFINNGLKYRVEGFGGLLLQNCEGQSALDLCMLHETEKYKITNNPDPIIDMMQIFSCFFGTAHDGSESFLKNIMTLTPCRILPRLIAIFDSIAFVNNEGKLLIHISIERGLKWVEGLEHIYAANRPALLKQDPQNCYPLLLAAVGPKSDLNTVFELMRRELCPVISKHGDNLN